MRVCRTTRISADDRSAAHQDHGGRLLSVPDWLLALPSEQALIDATRVVIHTQEQAGIDPRMRWRVLPLRRQSSRDQRG